jgi:hypothetical protein
LNDIIKLLAELFCSTNELLLACSSANLSLNLGRFVLVGFDFSNELIALIASAI